MPNLADGISKHDGKRCSARTHLFRCVPIGREDEARLERELATVRGASPKTRDKLEMAGGEPAHSHSSINRDAAVIKTVFALRRGGDPRLKGLMACTVGCDAAGRLY